jgi:SulP family sulfate permease
MTATRTSIDRDTPAIGKSLLLGGLLGVDTIGHCVALATLAFAGPLAFALGYGTMLILLSSAVVSLVLAWRSVFPGAAGIAEDTTIAILAPAMVLAAGSVTGTPEERLATGVAVMGISTLLSGVGLYLIGRFNLGRIARIMPFPVAAGFLAGSGWLLIASALFLLTHTSSLADLAQTLRADGLPPNLLLGIALVVALVIASRAIGGALAAFLPLSAALAAFYLGLALAGLTLEDARAMGLLPAAPTDDFGQYPDIALFGLIDWTAVATVSLTILAVVMLNAIAFMLNVSGIEMAVRTDISIDAEARTTGATNIAIGAFGGILGFVASDSTIVAHKLGCNSRILGLGLGLTTLVGCIFAGQIVSHVPTFMAAGLLLYFGVMMLTDWLILTRARLSLHDWAIIPIILGVTVAVDILAAIVVGMLVALLIFVYNYALLPVIRFEGSGATRRSPVDRTPEDEVILAARGARIHVLALQGYLFFGSVEKVIDAVRRRIAQSPPPVPPS